jgi:hypothetical protein
MTGDVFFLMVAMLFFMAWVAAQDGKAGKN